MSDVEKNVPGNGESMPPDQTPEHKELSGVEKFKRDLNKIDAIIELLLGDVLPDPQAIRLAWAMRANLIEEFIDSLEPVADDPQYRQRIQFDILIDKADIFNRLGYKLRYLMELDGAEGFALEYHMDDVAISLGEEIDSKVDELDNSPDAIVIKLRGKINYDNREFLRVLVGGGIEMYKLIETIRQMVIKEGGDADAVLGSLGL